MTGVRTYRLIKYNNEFLAFEIENTPFILRGIARMLKKCPDVSSVELRSWPKSGSNDVHLRFKFKGRTCKVWEAFGDDDRLWIGPEDVSLKWEHIISLEELFKSHKTWWNLLGGA